MKKHTPEEQYELNCLAFCFQEFKQIFVDAANNSIASEAKIEYVTGELIKRLIKVFGEKDGMELFDDTVARIMAFYGEDTVARVLAFWTDQRNKQ